MEHVIGDENYDYVMLNVFVIESRIVCGRVCCESLGVSLFEFLYLYLWYNHITYVSNVCVWGTRPCVLWIELWYCVHNHDNRVVGIVMWYLPVSSYICDDSP